MLYLWKKCLQCGSKNTKKNGKFKDRQQYKCLDCSKKWVNKKRQNWIKNAYRDYTKGKQILGELSSKYKRSPKTIRRYFDKIKILDNEKNKQEILINITLDGTFFSRNYGILIARAKGKNIAWKEIVSETLLEYDLLLDEIDRLNYKPTSFIIDGRAGVKKLLGTRYSGIPIQHCQFHQVQTIVKYLTRNPKLKASIELKKIALSLTKSSKEFFTNNLKNWFERWKTFLNEKTIDTETCKSFYTHRKLRSAYFSLNRHLPYLFTYLDFPYLKIPNTTNSCDGSFAHWKSKVKLHPGLSKERRYKMIRYLLKKC